MKREEAAQRWKQRFAEELWAIRMRVQKEKTAGIITQEAPSFAAALRDRWKVQTKFQRQRDLAAALKVHDEAVSIWMAGKRFPKDHHCDRLYKLTGLTCFSREGRIAARREHRPNHYAKKVHGE